MLYKADFLGGKIMMIMITKPRGKLKKLAVAGALGLLVGVAVPMGYDALSDVGAMSLFAAGSNVAAPSVAENVPEKVRSEDEWGLPDEVRRVIFGEEPQVIRY